MIGATIIAPRAGEMIQEWVLAIEGGLKINQLASIIHPYPTYSMANMQVAVDVTMSGMLSGTSGRMIRGLTRMPRWSLRPAKAKSKIPVLD